MTASPGTVEASPANGYEPLVALSTAQNGDGGWGYGGGGSWVEPTALAVLAFSGSRHARYAREIQRAVDWLLAGRRPDGGWAPRPSVDQSSWVTGLVLLCLAARGMLTSSDPAIGWVLRSTGANSEFVNRLRSWLLGTASPFEGDKRAWPWVPGTAAWVYPTSMMILALEAVHARFPSIEISRRTREARQFLLSRRCREGGWDEGSARDAGYERGAFPETTGIALMALRGADAGTLASSVEVARNQIASARSIQARAWLTLGLLAQGRLVPPWRVEVPVRGVLDAALYALAVHAIEDRNVFIHASQGSGGACA